MREYTSGKNVDKLYDESSQLQKRIGKVVGLLVRTQDGGNPAMPRWFCVGDLERSQNSPLFTLALCSRAQCCRNTAAGCGCNVPANPPTAALSLWSGLAANAGNNGAIKAEYLRFVKCRKALYLDFWKTKEKIACTVLGDAQRVDIELGPKRHLLFNGNK